MTAAPGPIEFFGRMKWLDGRPLLDTIEDYRRQIFIDALAAFGPDGWPRYNRVLCGRGKKNWKTADLTLAALYRFLAWESAAGSDCFIVANDEEQAGDDLALAKKLIAVNRELRAEVKVLQKEIVRKDGAGRMQILPAQDVAGLHGKTYLFLGFDEIHGYRNYDLFEALSPDPTRLDVLTWITSYAGIRHSPGIPLYDLLKIGQAGEDDRMLFSWYSGDFTTDAALAGEDVTPEQRANPSVSGWSNPRYLDDQKRRLPPHKYRRLHLNLPGAPEGAAFSAEMVIDAIVHGRRAIPPREGVEYAGFVDMSGGSADDAVLCIGHSEDGRGVVDLLISQTGAAPFNPRAAVRKFADALREYRVHRVVGDRFAGETFRADFEGEGVFYEVAALTRSQIYETFGAKLNAGLVELPDVQKLQDQLLSLVVKASGRIDHLAGDHDDWANAVAGVVARLATDARPALIRARDLLAPEGGPVEMPRYADSILAVLIASAGGIAAVTMWAQCPGLDPGIPPLTLLDFEVSSFSGELIARAAARLEELHREIKRVVFGRFLWVPRALVQAVHLRGFLCEDIPAELMRDPQALALAAAVHITAGQVRMTAAAAEKARTSPLAGALSFQAGERVDADPLRFSLLTAIVLALTPADAVIAPVLPGARLTAA